MTVAPEVADANEAVDIAPADAGSGGVVLDPAMIAAGQTAYSTICTACHGMNAQGVPGTPSAPACTPDATIEGMQPAVPPA